MVAGLGSMLSPSWAGRFRHNRDMYRAYTADSTHDADAAFRPRLRSGDSDVKRAHRLVMARCRDQAQNNPLISGGIERICNNVVRSGIFPLFQFRGTDDKLDRQVNLQWDRLFHRWARYCDATGHDTYGGLQRLGLRHMWSDGQYFIHRVYDDSRPGIIPLRLELLETDQLDSTVDGTLSNGNTARGGIEYHKKTAIPYQYHFHAQHPGDDLALGRSNTLVIPAGDIAHIWDRRRISQHAGISWLVAVVILGQQQFLE